MNTITTHVLDLATGRPASGVAVTLEFRPHPRSSWVLVGQGTTDSTGRVSSLCGSLPLQAGDYRLTFDSGSYFRDRGIVVFYPEIVVGFHVDTPDEHYHVPLLLSPHGYTTYRGS